MEQGRKDRDKRNQMQEPPHQRKMDLGNVRGKAVKEEANKEKLQWIENC
jgi:hypothetical protein